MVANNNGELKVIITQDKLVDILMHAATREDIKNTREELRNEMHTIRDELRTEMHAIRDELRTEIYTVRDELRTEIHAIRDELRTEIHAARSESREELKRLDSKIDKITWGIVIAIFVPIAIQIFSHFIK